MRAVCLILMAALFVACVTQTSFARSASTTRSSKSNTDSDYIEKKCKTAACFKKHPGGTYVVSITRKKKK